MLDKARVERILRSVDLMALVSRDTRLHKAATTCGGEWAGPCPFCGGKDRFHVQPNLGRWWCRQCSPDEHWRDAIAYIQRREGLSFVKALDYLDGNPSYQAATPREPVAPPELEPTEAWRATCAPLLAECQENLWDIGGFEIRRYLKQERGLTPVTMQQRGLGYNPTYREVAGLKIAAGILIPWYVGSDLWHINIRRMDAKDKDRRYLSVEGGHPHLYGSDQWRGQRTLVLVEGEFDAMLLTQQAGDLADFAAIRCKQTMSQHTAALVSRASVLLIAYDKEVDAQEKATKLACTDWRMSLIHLPPGPWKDATEAWKGGVDLHGWLDSVLHQEPGDQLVRDFAHLQSYNNQPPRYNRAARASSK